MVGGLCSVLLVRLEPTEQLNAEIDQQTDQNQIQQATAGTGSAHAGTGAGQHGADEGSGQKPAQHTAPSGPSHGRRTRSGRGAGLSAEGVAFLPDCTARSRRGGTAHARRTAEAAPASDALGVGIGGNTQSKCRHAGDAQGQNFPFFH